MNKKLSIVPAIALLFLAGCGSNEGSQQSSTVSKEQNDVTLTSATNSSKFSGTQELDINKSYPIGGAQATIKGKLTLENGIVKSIEIIDAKGPIQKFSEGISEKIVGKDVQGLQVDTISGASLTTAAFNEYLKDITK